MNFHHPLDLVFLRILGATVAAAAGAGIGLAVKHPSHRMLCGLVSFAAGGLLAVTGTHIVPESVHILGVVPAIFAIAFGLALFYVIGRYVYSLCPACSATDSEKGFFQLSVLMMVSMGLHSLTDGLAIVAGSEISGRMGTQIGFLIFVAVSYHKIPEGLALMSVVRGAGHRALKAFGITLLIETVTGLGALIGLFLISLNPHQLGLLLAMVAGSFLYIVFFAILKEMWQHERTSIAMFTTLGFLSILLLDWGLDTLHLS